MSEFVIGWTDYIGIAFKQDKKIDKISEANFVKEEFLTTILNISN